MKILVVADIHYALPQFDWVVAAAPSYDLVIIAGDLLDTNSMVDPGTQIVVVLKYLQRLKEITRVIVCSGNHDIDLADAEGEKHERRGSAVLAQGDGCPRARRRCRKLTAGRSFYVMHMTSI